MQQLVSKLVAEVKKWCLADIDYPPWQFSVGEFACVCVSKLSSSAQSAQAAPRWQCVTEIQTLILEVSFFFALLERKKSARHS